MRTTVINLCRATVILTVVYVLAHPQADAASQAPVMVTGLLLVALGVVLEIRRKLSRIEGQSAAQPERVKRDRH